MPDARRLDWEARHAAASPPAPPSPFVCDALDLVARRTGASPDTTPEARRAIDVACGRGRHALLLAERGYRVVAVDYARSAATALAARARAASLAIDVVVADVTTWPFGGACFDLVIVVDFLERPLVPALRAAVTPGGVLILETFLAGHERLGHPRNPAFLLRRGELGAACADWTVLTAYEDDTGAVGACRAGIAAERPAR